MTQSDKEMLAQDTIRIALNIAGYDIENTNQFERASTILDVATEYAALTNVKDYIGKHCMIRKIDGELFEPVAWERIDKGDAMTE